LVESYDCSLLQTYTCATNSITPPMQVCVWGGGARARGGGGGGKTTKTFACSPLQTYTSAANSNTPLMPGRRAKEGGGHTCAVGG
jgi:hypothetical protein